MGDEGLADDFSEGPLRLSDLRRMAAQLPQGQMTEEEILQALNEGWVVDDVKEYMERP